MIPFFKKEPIKALKREYNRKLKEGMDYQRSGKIIQYAACISEAESIRVRIEKLEAELK